MTLSGGPTGPPSKYEIAVFCYDITKHLDHEVRTQNFDSAAKANGVTKALNRERALASICPNLNKLDVTLAKQLRDLGVNAYSLARKADSLERKIDKVIKAHQGQN